MSQSQKWSALRGAKLCKTQVTHVLKLMTVQVALWCFVGVGSLIPRSATLFTSSMAAIVDSQKQRIRSRHKLINAKFNKLTQNPLTNAVLLPLRFLALALSVISELTICIVIATLTACDLAVSAISCSALNILCTLYCVGIYVYNIASALARATRNSIEKCLSREQHHDAQVDSKAEPTETAEHDKPVIVARAAGYLVALIAAALAIFILVPVASIAAALFFIPIAYLCNTNEKFRDEVLNLMLSHLSYKDVKSFEDLEKYPANHRDIPVEDPTAESDTTLHEELKASVSQGIACVLQDTSIESLKRTYSTSYSSVIEKLKSCGFVDNESGIALSV